MATLGEESKEQDTIEERANAAEENISPSSESSSSKKKKKKKKKQQQQQQQQRETTTPSETTQNENGDGDEGKETTTTETTTEGEQETTTTGAAPKESGAPPKTAAPKDLSSGPVVSVTKRTRPPYKYDPEKITLRFLFANRDGLTVTVECKPTDTIGEVKGQLLSVWPEDLKSCTNGDLLRLICMGKGILTPDSRTLKDCDVPVFKTHPTPVNVAVRPTTKYVDTSKSGKEGVRGGGSSTPGGSSSRVTEPTGQGCGCVIS